MLIMHHHTTYSNVCDEKKHFTVHTEILIRRPLRVDISCLQLMSSTYIQKNSTNNIGFLRVLLRKSRLSSQITKRDLAVARYLLAFLCYGY
jgi:hypothetical protein